MNTGTAYTIKHIQKGLTPLALFQSVVIHNPSAIDGGTVFIPRDGYHYFIDTLK